MKSHRKKSTLKYQQLTLDDIQPNAPVIDTSIVDTSSEKYLSIYRYDRWSMISMANGETRTTASGARYTPSFFVIDLTESNAVYDLKAFEELVAEGLAMPYPKCNDATHVCFKPVQEPPPRNEEKKPSKEDEEFYWRNYYYSVAESFFKNPACKFRLKIDYANPGGLSKHPYFQDAIADMEAKGRIVEEVCSGTWKQFIATDDF